MAGLSTSHIFISYSRRDTDVMQRIVSYLRGQGLKAWVDNEKLVPGTPIWEKEIEKAINAAYAVVVILSPDAKESVWVLNELTLADESKKRVFPVLVRGDFRVSIPFRLVTRQFVDLRSNEPSGLESLGVALSQYLDELNRIEEERQAAERESERQRQDEAQQEQIRIREAAEKEQLAREQEERNRIAKEEAEKREQEKAERMATEKLIAQLKAEREVAEREVSKLKARHEVEGKYVAFAATEFTIQSKIRDAIGFLMEKSIKHRTNSGIIVALQKSVFENG